MLLNSVFKKFIAMAAVGFMSAPVVAQVNEAAAPEATVVKAAVATLSVEGKLTGNVINDEMVQVPNAKISLVADGKVIDAVTADGEGNFSFTDVKPGPYKLLGATDKLFGAQPITARTVSFAKPVATSRIVLSNASPSQIYQGIGSTPCGCACGGSSGGFGGGGFGGGGFGGGGFGGGGFGGGGAFSGGGGGLLRGGLAGSRRLFLVGGIATAIAVAVGDNDDDDDASPIQ